MLRGAPRGSQRWRHLEQAVEEAETGNFLRKEEEIFQRLGAEGYAEGLPERCGLARQVVVAR